MPINTPHPLYTDNIAIWQRCRDAYLGEDAVKARATTYLPKISPLQWDAEYEAYKARASYYGACARSVDGFVGALSRKRGVIELPTGLQPLIEDATGDGVGLPDFIKSVARETLLQGRGGVLVDFDDKLGRPVLKIYPVESIINWGDGWVVVEEHVFESDAADRFDVKLVPQLRFLRLEDGRYVSTTWRKATSAIASPEMGEWRPVEETTPTLRGAPLDELPWFWLSPQGTTSAIVSPPLLGMVNTSLSHYRTSADLEHGRHFTALPTLYMTGATPDGEPIQVGGGAIIQLSDPAAKVGYAEFTGAGLRSLEQALTDKEHQMATLGAAIWGGRKGIEAAETARIRTAGENSLLMSIVSANEEALTAALTFAAEWSGSGGKVTLQLNRDFVDQQIEGQLLVGMVQAFQAGAMSLDAFLFALQQSEMLPPDTDLEEEAAKLRAEKAARATAAAKVAAGVADAPVAQ